ncbi:MAG: hypothetical protein NTY88_13260 [Bacteroidetes bacterium]|nr:hypothetical protein [Bacteroidota bacterium]
MFASSFEQEEQSFKNRKSGVAAFVTIALHALIFLFLLWMILTPPNPPYTDSAGGVTVNFGTSETGTGDVQPMTLTPIEADFTPAASAASQQPTAVKEDVVTQDLEDAPVVENSKTETKKPKPAENTTNKNNHSTNTTNSNHNTSPVPIPEEPKADPNALFHKGANGKPNNSKGDGTGGGQGDQGKPNGDPNSKSYLDSEGGKGTGPGKGDLKAGISLKGRKSASLPPPKFCQEKGNVIIDITVDRVGNVVDAKYHREGSTITDNCSIQNAKTAALKSKFNADSQADDLQYGSINYVFTVQ